MIEAAVAATLAEHPETARAVRDGVPLAWGTLAAQGVITLRDLLGRTPTADQRRTLWSSLWHAVWT